ncbi:serine/threonine protein kinase [Lentzea alba]|uniref:serine/threonine-protein kinase n=1 Tax=Lentzea alba TaxID=2714351 RepID=UPI0039BFDAA0
MVGRTIAERYRLEEHLGSGGMGEVWRATDLQLDETVALKRPREGDARHEARIGAELSHPNVITVHGTVTDGAEQWLVMEYLPSRSLSEIIEADGPITPQRAAKIGAQLADALAAMHEKNMVHRDVKPGNVLVADNDVTKLSDFGISRWAEQTRVGGGDVAGTAAYLAPEVADGHEARPASDVFALGATLFAAVEGTSPWGSPDAGSSEQLRRAKAYDITPARHSGPFGDLLAQLMRQNPQERPATENVRAMLEGAELPNPKRRKAIIIGAALVTAAAVAVAAVFYLQPTSGTMGDAYSMNVCGLASNDVLGRFNAHKVTTDELDSYYFDSCMTWMAFSAQDEDDAVRVSYEVKLFAPFEPPEQRGELGQVTRTESTDTMCANRIKLVDGNAVNVWAEHIGGPSRPLCDIADAAAANARAVLADGQIPRRGEPWPRASLGGVNVCHLLERSDVADQLGVEAAPYPYAERPLGSCGWDANPRQIVVQSTREGPLDPAKDGEHVNVGGGRLAYFETKARDDDNWPNSCAVDIEQRVAREKDPKKVEILTVILSDSKVIDPEVLCPGAIKLANAAASRLPQP